MAKISQVEPIIESFKTAFYFKLLYISWFSISALK